MAAGIPVKGQRTFEKRRHRDLVGRIEHHGIGRAGLERAVGQARGRGTARGPAARTRAAGTSARSSRGSAAVPALGPREGVLDRQPHVGRPRAARSPTRRVSSTSEWTIDCGCTTTSMADGAATSNSQCASITSRPLFISVAESMVILRPIRQVGWLSASSGVTAASRSRGQVAERSARRGEDQAPHLAGRAPGAGTGGWRCARCRPAARRRRARAPRPSRGSPAMTSTSLLASAMRLPAAMAASTASSASVPDEAHSTMSTSSRDTSSHRPRAAASPSVSSVARRSRRRARRAPRRARRRWPSRSRAGR